MKISVFTTHGNLPYNPNDGCNLDQSMACYEELADEVILINGASEETPWPYKFSWDLIGQQFQRGYEAATGDYVIHADLDFIFHERDFGRIRQALKDYPTAPAVSFYKWQFVLPDRYNLKSRLIIAVNKAQFGDRIKFNGGGDLCQPTLDGIDLDLDEIPQAGVPFYNYEKLMKTKEQIVDDVERMDDAYLSYFGRTLYSTDTLTAYEGWYKMMEGRFAKPQEKISLDKHPQYIQETIRNLTPEQFGYNGFGLIEGRVYGS